MTVTKTRWDLSYSLAFVHKFAKPLLELAVCVVPQNGKTRIRIDLCIRVCASTYVSLGEWGRVFVLQSGPQEHSW